MDEKKKKVLVTILLPAYNEEQSIGTTIRRIRELYPDYEILVVDDGSTDNTLREAMAAGANVWPHPYNIGNGAAIKSGLRAAQGEWVVMMDADGQHAPEDIAKLLENKDTYDMVVGGTKQQLRNGDAPRYRQYRLQLVRLLRDQIQGAGPDLGFQAGQAVHGPAVHLPPSQRTRLSKIRGLAFNSLRPAAHFARGSRI